MATLNSRISSNHRLVICSFSLASGKTSGLPADHAALGRVPFASIAREAAREWFDLGASLNALDELPSDGWFDANASWLIDKAVANPKNDEPANIEPND